MQFARFFPLLALGALSVFTGQSASGATLYFDTAGPDGVLTPGSGNWTTEAKWNTSSTGAITSLISWTDGSDAAFATKGVNTMTISSAVNAASVSQSETGTSTTISGSGNTLTIAGNANAVSNSSGSALTFAGGLTVTMAPANADLVQEWNAGAGSDIIVNAVLGGNVVGSTSTLGGLSKTGAGTLFLNGVNTYTGNTRLAGGILEAGNASAFGASNISFEGGTLRYKSGITTDFSSKFQALTSAAANIDTNGNNVLFATAITGSGGLNKKGLGTLTLAAANTFTGQIVVEGGILKAASATGATPFGNRTGGSVSSPDIIVQDGATLDVNGNTSAGNGGKSYHLHLQGAGVGGLGAFINSGTATSNQDVFASVTLLGNTTMGGTTRFDFDGSTVFDGNGFTLTKVGNFETAWTAAMKELGDVIISAGTVTLQNNDVGDNTKTFFVNSKLMTWSGRTIDKQVVLNGGLLSANGSTVNSTATPTAVVIDTSTWNGQMTLNVPTSGSNRIAGENGFKDIKYKGKITGAGGFDWSGPTGTANLTAAPGAPVVTRTSVLYLLNNANDFQGDISINQGVLRLSDSTAAGTLGETNNNVSLLSTSSTAPGILDLFGTSQTIGALNATNVNNYVQNNRSATTSKLTVGTDNVSGSFAGVLRDNAALPGGNALIANEGATGLLAFEKVGTGRQILTGINSHTGATTVSAGEIQIGSGTATTSTARSGNGAVLVKNTATISGNGILGGTGASVTIDLGGTLKVGTSDQTAFQTLGLDGTFTNNGTLALDVWGYTAGSGSSSNSDVLKFNNNVLMGINGILSLTDKTGNSATWVANTWFQVFDWTSVTTMGNRDVAFLNFLLPTLGAGLDWDKTRLASDGRLYIIAIPEPSRALLLTFAICGFLLRRKRGRL